MSKDDDNKPVMCKNCNGSGTVFVKVGNKKQARTCGVCKGLGTV